ncbi:MAG: hypothetical protein AAB198_06860 [Actinomycetota bacterium]
MDPPTIAALSAAGVLLLALVTLGFLSRRRGASLRRSTADADEAAADQTAIAAAASQQAAVAAAGEREAVWVARSSAAAASAASDRVRVLEAQLLTTENAATETEHQIDELRDELRRSHTDLTRSRSEGEAATERVAELAFDLQTAGRDLSLLRSELAEARRRLVAVLEPDPGDDDLLRRLHAAIASGDLLRDRIAALETSLAATAPTGRPLLPPDPWEHRRELEDRDASIKGLTAELERAHRGGENARAEVERLAADIGRIREEADRRVASALSDLTTNVPVERSSMLTVREAEIRELEQQLATLTAARNSELRRLNERIASLERFYIDAEHRDGRITELETELKQATELLEAVRVDATNLEARLTSADRELVSARQAVTAVAEVTAQLQVSQSRVAELEALTGSIHASSGEVEQLRTMLAAERERNVRLVRRSSIEGRGEIERTVAAATRPLHEAIARLEEELASKVAPPPAVITDDVRQISGIGPKIAAILAANGVTSIRRIAAFTDSDIARIGPQLPVYPQRIHRDRWIEQAKELLAGR